MAASSHNNCSPSLSELTFRLVIAEKGTGVTNNINMPLLCPSKGLYESYWSLKKQGPPLDYQYFPSLT